MKRLGITPARAGKTQGVADGFRYARDHPRSCGKDLRSCCAKSGMRGSPPLVRERQNVEFSGATYRVDHPRSCGKDGAVEEFGMLYAGSPPLVRERQLLRTESRRDVGITPARAGKTVHAYR